MKPVLDESVFHPPLPSSPLTNLCALIPLTRSLNCWHCTELSANKAQTLCHHGFQLPLLRRLTEDGHHETHSANVAPLANLLASPPHAATRTHWYVENSEVIEFSDFHKCFERCHHGTGAQEHLFCRCR